MSFGTTSNRGEGLVSRFDQPVIYEHETTCQTDLCYARIRRTMIETDLVSFRLLFFDLVLKEICSLSCLSVLGRYFK